MVSIAACFACTAWLGTSTLTLPYTVLASTSALTAVGLQDVEFAFERSRLREWIADIRALIQKDLRGIPGWGAHTRCLLPGYYVMRFGKAPESYIGNAAGLKEPVYTQVNFAAATKPQP